MKRGLTTHLVIPNSDYSSTGRLAKAQEWGITVVYPDFLKKLAVDGLAFQVPKKDGKPVLKEEEEEELVEDPEFVMMDLDNGDDDVVVTRESLGPFDQAEEEKPKVGPLTGCKIAIHRDLEVSPESALPNQAQLSSVHDRPSP